MSEIKSLIHESGDMRRHGESLKMIMVKDLASFVKRRRKWSTKDYKNNKKLVRKYDDGGINN